MTIFGSPRTCLWHLGVLLAGKKGLAPGAFQTVPSSKFVFMRATTFKEPWLATTFFFRLKSVCFGVKG
jgi:hypothetical protein